MTTTNRTLFMSLAIAGLACGLLPPAVEASLGPTPGGDAWDGEGVDLSTGHFAHAHVDLSTHDAMPVSLVRISRPGVAGAFGIGASHAYELRLVAAPPFLEARLDVPDGSAIHYVRTSPGSDQLGAVFAALRAPTPWLGSVVSWSGGWVLRTLDGMSYKFDADGRLERVTDAADRTAEILRAGGGPITRITSPGGRWIALAYDAANRIVQARDAGGRLVSYAYDSAGRLASVTDPEGGITRYTYDAQHRIATIADGSGALRLAVEYDAAGRVARQSRADQSTYQFAYVADGIGKVQRVDVTDPRGVIRRVAFDANGYRVADTRALGTAVEATTTWEHDAAGFALSVTDALGRRTAFTYDARGLVTAVTRQAGSPGARTTALGYSDSGTLAIPRVATATDPMGHVLSIAYDARGFPNGIADPLGLTTRLVVEAGALVQLGDPLGQSTALRHIGGAISQIFDPLGRVTERSYDAWVRLVSETDPLGKRTAVAYDRLDRVTEITDAAGGVTRVAYDAAGNVAAITDARGLTTRYVHDAMNRLIARTDQAGRTERFAYDAAGNRVSATDRSGRTTLFAYDELNRLVAVHHPDGSTTSYTWDAGHRLVRVEGSASGAITRTYDGHDQLLSETTPQGTVRFEYDAAGRRIRLAVDGEPAVEYRYDAAGRLVQITRGADVVEIGYDAAGRRASLAFPNGIRVEYAYNAASEVTAVTYRRGEAVLGEVAYAYDASGRRVRAWGTWARLGLPDAVASAAYDDANRPTAFGLFALAHDPDGNLLSDGVSAYTWDARNRLVAIDGPGVTADFAYDALGRRAAKRVDHRTWWYLYDGFRAVQEVGEGEPVTLASGDGLEHPILRWDGNGLGAVLADGAGSVLALADRAGAIVAEYTYTPFGASAGGPPGDANTYQFAGGENDGTGLYWQRGRYYHPVLQRWIQEHPAGFTGGDLNLYAYAGNDPVAGTVGTPAARIARREWTPAGAVAVDTAPATRLVGLPASPELERALSHPVVQASLDLTGGLPLPAPRTPDRLLSLPPGATDRVRHVDGWARVGAVVPVGSPFALRVR